jgi:ABC-2 type transport system ATP-binding protein
MADRMEIVVHVEDLFKRYGDLQAVGGVGFDVARGEVFGLLGPNGAGKTTALECIIGLRRPDGGSIEIAGIDALRDPLRARQIIGAQLQATALQDKITPRQALRLFGSFYDKSGDADKLIEQFELGAKADASFDTLSGGQRQRLAIALAMVNQPQVIFLDEPTAGLDPQARRELHAAIARMREAGRTILLTTHYVEEASRLCDRVAIIDHGMIAAIGRPDELIAASKALSSVVVSTARPLEQSRMATLAGVSRAVLEDGRWRVRTSSVTQTIMNLVDLIESEKNELLDLRIHHPTLEDVFLELTGSQLME